MLSVVERVIGNVKSGLRTLASPRGQDVEVVGGRPAAVEHGNQRLPLADVYEDAKEFLVVLDVPGADPADTAVFWDGSTLVVRASAESIGSGVEEQLEYTRTFELQGATDAGNAKTTMKDGVLTVRLPKRKSSPPRRVPIRVG
jgi:HSP20 family protein